MKKFANLSLIVFMSLFLVFSAYAAPSSKSVIKKERNLAKQQKKLRKQFNRLNTNGKARVVAARAGKSDDSDFDGVVDNLEVVAGKCDSDSDDDGVDDGDEYESGLDPNNDDSDDDGHGDADEFEVHGILESSSENAVIVDGMTYLIDSSTEFLDDDNHSVTLDFFEEGECVEVEGHNVEDVKVLEKMKSDDDC